MDPHLVAKAYFDAWNARDPEAIAALFVEGGLYKDPGVPDGVSGPALIAYTRGLFTSFPDLSFEVVSETISGEGLVAAQWIMRGTNTGPGQGPPTGRKVELPGADFIHVEGDKIRSLQGYFDGKTMYEQLGLQVLTLPRSIGPLTFGASNYMNPGNTQKPGAVSLTWIDVRDDKERDQIRQMMPGILTGMAQLPGFISFITANVGHRLFTVTAWEKPEHAQAMTVEGAHKAAMKRFFGPEIGKGAHTSVWAPERVNAVWTRCTSCQKMVDHDKLEGKCSCGAALPPRAAYW